MRLICGISILFLLVVASLGFSLGNWLHDNVLHVGVELEKEILPLQMGSRLYLLHGLKSHTWYEVKISYPASIPASFSIQLKRGKTDLDQNLGRKLLNTEKLIFKTNELELAADQGRLCVLVTVQPEGVVAIPRARERDHVIFNIVCDELLMGIPHKAWYVVVLVLVGLGLASVLPAFLPPYLLRKNESVDAASQDFTKDS